MYFRLGGEHDQRGQQAGARRLEPRLRGRERPSLRHRACRGGRRFPKVKPRSGWRLTTPQWPVMHAVLDGITRDQMMARHKSNHIHVVYAPDRATAREGDVHQGGGDEGARAGSLTSAGSFVERHTATPSAPPPSARAFLAPDGVRARPRLQRRRRVLLRGGRTATCSARSR